MQIGHIYSSMKNCGPPATCLKDVNGVLKQAKRGLDFVTKTVSTEADLSLPALRNTLLEIRDSANIATCKSEVRLGLDFSTAFLSNSNSEILARLTGEVLGPLSEEKLLGALTIGTNAFTYPSSQQLFQWVQRRNNDPRNVKIQTIATEILRAHPYSPALLTSGYPHSVPHRCAGQSGDTSKRADAKQNKQTLHIDDSEKLKVSSAGVKTAMRNIEIAAADMEMAMDRCIQAEKIFLTKVKLILNFFTMCYQFVLIVAHFEWGTI